jgi:opacity protein-like surface antigen
VQASAACQHSDDDPICFANVAIGGPFDTQTHNRVLPGWTVGAGLEAKIYGNLLLRGEYRFAQYSSNDRFRLFDPRPRRDDNRELQPPDRYPSGNRRARLQIRRVVT